MKKLSWRFSLWRLSFDCGWYSGENFGLLELILYENYDCVDITIFHLKIFKFCISIFWG
jgi:hypothetical protein